MSTWLKWIFGLISVVKTSLSAGTWWSLGASKHYCNNTMCVLLYHWWKVIFFGKKPHFFIAGQVVWFIMTHAATLLRITPLCFDGCFLIFLFWFATSLSFPLNRRHKRSACFWAVSDGSYFVSCVQTSPAPRGGGGAPCRTGSCGEGRQLELIRFSWVCGKEGDAETRVRADGCLQLCCFTSVCSAINLFCRPSELRPCWTILHLMIYSLSESN